MALEWIEIAVILILLGYTVFDSTGIDRNIVTGGLFILLLVYGADHFSFLSAQARELYASVTSSGNVSK